MAGLASLGGRPVLELASELVRISAAGLARIAETTGRDERSFLDPVLQQLESGRSPGQIVVEQWEGAWARSPARLIDYARY